MTMGDVDVSIGRKELAMAVGEGEDVGRGGDDESIKIGK